MKLNEAEEVGACRQSVCLIFWNLPFDYSLIFNATVKE